MNPALRLARARRWTGALGLASLVAVGAAQLIAFGTGEPFSPDVWFLSVPNAHFLGEQLRAGHLPFWDPHLFAGHPFLAELQTQVLYPPSVIWSVVDPRRGMAAFLVAHLVWAAAGAFALGRAFRLRPEASAAMALSVGLSPILVQHYEHPNLLCGISWIPWTCAAARWLARRPSVLRATALAAAWACAILAGAPELAAFGGVAALLCARPRLGWAVAGLGIGIALAAPGWLPFVELLRHSERAVGVAFTEVCHFELHRIDLPDLFAPFTEYAEPPHLHDHYFAQLFIGASVVVLAFAGRRRKWLWLVLALGVLALGDETPIFPALWAVLPPLHAVRSPAKAAGALALLFALHSGPGIQAWSRPGGRKSATLAIALAALAATGALHGGLSGAEAPWASSLAWTGAFAAILMVTAFLPTPQSRRMGALAVLAAELLAFSAGITRQITHALPPCPAKPELARPGRVLFDLGGDPHPPDDWPALCALGWPDRNLLADVDSLNGFVTPAPGEMHLLLRQDLPRVAEIFHPATLVLADGVDRNRYPLGQELLRRGRFTAYALGPDVRAWLHTGEGDLPVHGDFADSSDEVFALPGHDGELRILQTAYPGWTARLDGVPVPLETRDGIDTVRIPAGARRLELGYHPRWFTAGLVMFFFTLGGCAIWNARAFRSRRGVVVAQVGAGPAALPK